MRAPRFKDGMKRNFKVKDWAQFGTGGGEATYRQPRQRKLDDMGIFMKITHDLNSL
jgi:hypothetical protein